MINTNAFDYINVLDKGADAAWLRNQAIADNIANVSTPGYKRKEVDFASLFQKEMEKNRYTSIDDRVSHLDLDRLNASVYTDYAGFAYRLDGNNVDIENENAYMAENQLKYQGIIDCIDQEFQNLQRVMQ